MNKSWLSFSSPPSPAEIWQAAFADLCQRMSPCFGRRETRQHAQTYLQGLLSSTERKNGWQLAEEAGEHTPYAMQYLLGRASWESDDLRDCLHSYVSDTLGEAGGILVIDETGGSRKKGQNRWEFNGSTVELPGALKTARSASF